MMLPESASCASVRLSAIPKSNSAGTKVLDTSEFTACRYKNTINVAYITLVSKVRINIRYLKFVSYVRYGSKFVIKSEFFNSII